MAASGLLPLLVLRDVPLQCSALRETLSRLQTSLMRQLDPADPDRLRNVVEWAAESPDLWDALVDFSRWIMDEGFDIGEARDVIEELGAAPAIADDVIRLVEATAAALDQLIGELDIEVDDTTAAVALATMQSVLVPPTEAEALFGSGCGFAAQLILARLHEENSLAPWLAELMDIWRDSLRAFLVLVASEHPSVVPESVIPLSERRDMEAERQGVESLRLRLERAQGEARHTGLPAQLFPELGPPDL